MDWDGTQSISTAMNHWYDSVRFGLLRSSPSRSPAGRDYRIRSVQVLSLAYHPPPLLLDSTTLPVRRKGTANSRSGNVTAVVVAAVAEWKITCYACCVPFQTKFEETGFACERGHFYELRNRSLALDGSFAPTHLGIARRENFTNSAIAAAGHLGFRECFRRNAKTSMRNVLGS